MDPCADMLAMTGDRGLQVVRRLQDAGEKLTANTFRPFEGVYDPEDYSKIMDALEKDTELTAARMKEHVSAVLVERWWTWCLRHPELTVSRVHPSRRMHPSASAVAASICGCFLFQR